MELYSIMWKGRLFSRMKAESAEDAIEIAYEHILKRNFIYILRNELSARLSTEDEKVFPKPN